jgi:hypothetical protein
MAPGVAGGGATVLVLVLVTVDGVVFCSLLSCTLRIIRAAMMMASVPSTPAAQSSAR